MISRDEFERIVSAEPTLAGQTILATLSQTGTASTRMLRRVRHIDEATLRAELAELESAGLIRSTEGPDLLRRTLARLQGESYYTISAIAHPNPHVRMLDEVEVLARENPPAASSAPSEEAPAGEIPADYLEAFEPIVEEKYGHDDSLRAAASRARTVINNGRILPDPAIARLVTALGELRGWRLAHEPAYINECLSCGEETILETDDRGRLWKLHDGQRPLDAECMSGSRVPPALFRKLFLTLRLSAPLRAFEALTEGLRAGYCPECGGAIHGFCFRHHPNKSVGVVGYQ